MNRTRSLFVIVALAAMVPTVACGDRDKPEPPRDNVPTVQAEPSEPNQDVDASVAPGAEDPVDDKRSARATLYANQIRTRHAFDGAITAGKIGYVATLITVNAASASGASSADPTLVNGILVACTPTGNQDQFVDNVVLTGATGVITITLAANATANNTFRCISWKANAQGVR